MTKEISAYSASLRLDVGSSNQLCSICAPRGWRNRKHRYVSAANESAQLSQFQALRSRSLCTVLLLNAPLINSSCPKSQGRVKVSSIGSRRRSQSTGRSASTDRLNWCREGSRLRHASRRTLRRRSARARRSYLLLLLHALRGELRGVPPEIPDANTSPGTLATS